MTEVRSSYRVFRLEKVDCIFETMHQVCFTQLTYIMNNEMTVAVMYAIQAIVINSQGVCIQRMDKCTDAWSHFHCRISFLLIISSVA